MISDEEIKRIIEKHKDIFDTLQKYDETGELPPLKNKSNRKNIKK